MKKYIMLVLCIVCLLAGCSQERNDITIFPTTTIPDGMGASTEYETLEGNLFAVSVPVSTECIYLNDGTELFYKTRQYMQLTHPNTNVADRIILDFLNRIDAAGSDSDRILTAAKNEYVYQSTWFPYFHQVIYSPTRIDSSVLSLYGTQSSYSGGTHSSMSCLAANYDMSTGDTLTLGSILHKDAPIENLILRILEKLAIISESSIMFDDYENVVRNRFHDNESLYQDFYFTTTGLNFFFQPYEIAPYASGIITVEIPYDELLGLIYDGYFPDESEPTEGDVKIGAFLDTDMSQFTEMTEIYLTSGEDIYVIYPEKKVLNLRISHSGDGMSQPEYTLFAAYEMSSHNAVVLSLAKEEIDKISINFDTCDGTASIRIK